MLISSFDVLSTFILSSWHFEVRAKYITSTNKYINNRYRITQNSMPTGTELEYYIGPLNTKNGIIISDMIFFKMVNNSE